LVLSIAKGSVPLYMQIKDLLVARVTKGEWAPGDIIPSEMQLAQQLDVSQGTVRKAIVSDSGDKILPECRTISCRRKRASRQEASKLGISSGSRVICIERIRELDNLPTIVETITLPTDLFNDLGKQQACELPNTLYELYETQFGITIHRADEQLRAVAASDYDASLLGLEPGTPLLEIERIALTLDGTPVELRKSRCNTARHYYQNSVL